ncbi:hypothetical protein SKAU_G00019100 [Synaphobranchus kaupii]|uniref:A-kinase anchor protein 2 C-terminal domain-containing protein n=1 Tax=Synaphobranchus kaupii TaxID=118154 RepID=A0A9Q1JE58_SYNKA|nr:hypothetical protein SKAU_G00019100 [Synaphobranchus kaupii]
MEMEAPFHNAQTGNQCICCSTNDQNGFTKRQDSMEGDVMREMHHLDKALEENSCDSEFGINSSGPSSSGLTGIDTSDTEPSVLFPDIQTAHVNQDVVEGKIISCNIEDSYYKNPSSHSVMVSQDCKALASIKNEARFELRAFQEEKKPSKLFDCSSEKEPIRVKKVRDTEEMEELERERQELIHSQAVKKNPGIATKWWNPPQIKTVEEVLDPDQLESHRKYQERKQKKLESSHVQQELPTQTVSFIPVEAIKMEDLLIEQINFSTTQNQLQLKEETSHIGGLQTDVTPELCSGSLFSGGAEATHVEKSISSSLLENTNDQVHSTQERSTEVKTQSVNDHPADTTTELTRVENELKRRNDTRENGDFTSAQNVLTVLEDPELSSANSSCHNEEIDSGLDDLSLQSQDTAAQELLSNDFSMDNVSDSGASNEATNAFLENSLGDFSLPATPQATSPVSGEMGGRTTTQSESSMSPFYPGISLTEEPIEYHTRVPVQNAIQQACKTDGWESQKMSLPNPERYEEVHHEKHLGESSNVKIFIQQPSQICDKKFKFNPPQVLSPVQEKRDIAQEIPVNTPPVSNDTFLPLTMAGGQSPQAGEKHEFNYFTKYSEAAELRSTASLTRPRDTEISSGPFRLRSHKQRTLSMIEEEIRAAQEREQELKRQRQTQGLNTAPSHKERTTNIPTRLVVTAKKAPGKIHCAAFTPLSQDCPNSPTLSDVSSEGSEGGQHPKNFMQTLMEDYEFHKVKLKEKMEDNKVLEAMRITRRKSNMAVRWEAGVYTNQEEDEE